MGAMSGGRRTWPQLLAEFARDAQAYAPAADAVFDALREWRDADQAAPGSQAARWALQNLRDVVDLARAGGVL
jgi:hypothetical protein